MRVLKNSFIAAAAATTALDVDRIEEILLHREKDRDLQFDRHGAEGRLLEELNDAATAVELGLGLGVEVGAELGEGREFAELRQLALEFAADLLGGLDLRGGTDARDERPDGVRRDRCLLDEEVEVSRKIWPSVIEITFVGM